MELLWTWRGKFFGYRLENDLWTYTGRHVGRISDNNEVYDRHGTYMGEIMNGRLISHKGKRNYRFYSFTPWASRMRMVKYVDYVGYAMYAGYEDFLEYNDEEIFA